MTTLPPEPEPAPVSPPSAHRRVVAAFERLAHVERPDLWISLRTLEEVLVDAKAVDERVRAGEDLPLAGTVLAVKDLIDVAGLPTTAGCPGFSRVPVTSATAVTRLTGAGAVVLGKTNLDQFGSGLAGTRSPYGAVVSATDPQKVAGGSSSGSAVAVALGIADLALGTDTAGSGRVPAALNAVIGLKPTLGLVPKTGVFPASASFDCVSVFASSLALGQRALAVLTGPDGMDPSMREWPADVPLGVGERPRVAIPDEAGLVPLSAPAKRAFLAAVASLEAAGARIEPLDLSVFFEAGQLLYGSALVAERYASAGEILAAGPEGADPTVSGIVAAAGTHLAHEFADAQSRVTQLRAAARELLGEHDALVLPTVSDHPDLSEALADPAGVSARLATYTAFANVLDLAAVTVPVRPGDRRPFGVTIATRAFHDQVAIELAGLLTGEPTEPYPPEGVDLVVFGAHLRGQPLNDLLHGARFVAPVRTAERYRMVLLDTAPAQPGVVAGRTALDGERWRLSPAAFGRFAATLADPFVLGYVTLEDGSTPLAVLVHPDAADGAPNLDGFESWRGYLRFVSTAGLRSPG
ncbi:allophanate hydrolase [Amycolatopsis sp. FDAARGOS 1241]|uniref:allophanate hydrolase n=1 Tax=Amycolatopsis sp. FDAARGOS 1241 TaxID=2778070 RepID=UPI00194F601C|nr:allophanate hydrolase [Amycolatopsis sp. FDAARGOS 1241]QRP48743.1 allophanate hydrolase [Amycolatopsis sp. FDAARGOS 1241]